MDVVLERDAGEKIDFAPARKSSWRLPCYARWRGRRGPSRQAALRNDSVDTGVAGLCPGRRSRLCVREITQGPQKAAVLEIIGLANSPPPTLVVHRHRKGY